MISLFLCFAGVAVAMLALGAAYWLGFRDGREAATGAKAPKGVKR